MATPIRGRKKVLQALATRPLPPATLLDPLNWSGHFVPGPEVVEWIRATLLDDASPLFNEEHVHLRQALIGVVWTNVPYKKQMNRVAATAEIPMFRCGGWQKARQEEQIKAWFDGLIPHFVITIDALVAAASSDAQWCAIIDHELYHCAQEQDAFGGPKFRMDGSPAFAMRGHDVEEFVGVVRRYGAAPAAGRTAELVAAALAEPLIAPIDVSRVCGTCQKKAA